MATNDRTTRLDEYREKSLQADILAGSGQTVDALTLLKDFHDKAATAGDEDYRLFFEAELCGYTTPDLRNQIDLLEKAIEWCHSEEAQPDFFILRNKGVYLSQMDDEKGALEQYDRALAIKPDDYAALRNKGVSLSKMGDAKGAIEQFDRALAIEPDDYNALRNKGVALSKMGNEKGAIEQYDRALAIKPDDYAALRNKGVSLSKMGDLKSAIEHYDRALAIKPDDYDSLRNKGVALSKMGDEKGAIEQYDRALAIKPDDYDSLRQKGVSFSRMDDEKGAIEQYVQALAIKPDDFLSVREWAVAALNMGDEAVACDKIKQAALFNPEKYQADFRTIMRHTKNDPDKEWQDLFSDKPEISTKPIDRLQEIRDFVGAIRKNLGVIGQNFLEQKESAENNVKMFLQPESLLVPDRSFFFVLRKWNSYTPAIPTDDDERSRGGGYFIYRNGKGTVIDPGYNFIENFHQAGCRIHDIDSIVITHAHNDHTIDFESICTLLHQYNRAAFKSGHPKKKIRLFFNNGAFKKFSGLLNLMDKNFEPFHTLNVGNEYQIDEGMQLTVLPAFHDEVVSRDQSIGLLFTVQCGETKRKIVFTSDTGLFPLCPEADEPKPNTSRDELDKAYPDSAALGNPDLLVVHIGSIKKEELEQNLNEEIGKCLYPNHLGLIGTAWMITQLRPKLALVSEFGEEMRLFRRAIVERIEEDVVHKIITTEPKPRVAPADLAFVYDIAQGSFLCCADDTWSDVAEIAYDYDDDSTKENLYYFSRENLNKIGRSAYTPKINEFRQRRKERKGMYFRSTEENGK